MLETLVIVLIFCTAGIALFQIMILTQCGIVHRRLGLRLGDRQNALTKPEEIVGKKVGLPAGASVLFASVSCSQCAAVLRVIKGNIASKVAVYLVDKTTSAEVEESLSRYPEFSFAAQPGEALFNELQADGIPLFVRTDSTGRVEQAIRVDSPSMLLSHVS